MFAFPEVFVPLLLCSCPVQQGSICSPWCCQIWNQLDIPAMAGLSLPAIPRLPLYSPEDSALLVVSHPTLFEGACRRNCRAAPPTHTLLVRRSRAVCHFLQCKRKQKPMFIVNAEPVWASRCCNKHVPSCKPLPSGGAASFPSLSLARSMRALTKKAEAMTEGATV